MSKKGETELIHQKEELDILESIYMEELELHSALPPYKFSVQCRPYLDFHFDDILEKFTVRLDVELSNNYPLESPKCEIKHHVDKITNTDMQYIHKVIENTAKELKGSPMLFEIVETVRGWLQTSVVDPELRPKKIKKNLDDDDDDEDDDGEPVVNLTKKETYTPVTKDSFLEWKARFDAEMEKIKRAKGEFREKDDKLSGKQLFERDMNLMMSDMLDKDEDVEETEIEIRRDEEEENKEEDDEAEEERGKKLFYYNEDLFEDDVDLEDDEDA